MSHFNIEEYPGKSRAAVPVRLLPLIGATCLVPAEMRFRAVNTMVVIPQTDGDADDPTGAPTQRLSGRSAARAALRAQIADRAHSEVADHLYEFEEGETAKSGPMPSNANILSADDVATIFAGQGIFSYDLTPYSARAGVVLTIPARQWREFKRAIKEVENEVHNASTWEIEAIKALPDSVFVWLDELVPFLDEHYRRHLKADGTPFNERPVLTPLIPLDLQSVVYKGFEHCLRAKDESEPAAGAEILQEAASSHAPAGGAESVPMAAGRAPLVFAERFEKLLLDIEKVAKDMDPPFDRNAMPGIREDLWKMACKTDVELKVAKDTFFTYIKGICKFKPGSRSSDYYKDILRRLSK